MITIALTDVLTIIGSVLLIFLIILVSHTIGLIKDVRKLVDNAEAHISNTIANVDRVSENASTMVVRIFEKMLKILGMRLEKVKKNADENDEK